jgi:hypothetical protein
VDGTRKGLLQQHKIENISKLVLWDSLLGQILLILVKIQVNLWCLQDQHRLLSTAFGWIVTEEFPFSIRLLGRFPEVISSQTRAGFHFLDGI